MIESWEMFPEEFSVSLSFSFSLRLVSHYQPKSEEIELIGTLLSAISLYLAADGYATGVNESTSRSCSFERDVELKRINCLFEWRSGRFCYLFLSVDLCILNKTHAVFTKKKGVDMARRLHHRR